MSNDLTEAKEFVWGLAEELNTQLGQPLIRPKQQRVKQQNISLVFNDEQRQRLAIRPSKSGYYVAPNTQQCVNRLVPFIKGLTGRDCHGYHQPNQNEPYWYIRSSNDVRKIAFYFAGLPLPQSANIKELNLAEYTDEFEQQVKKALNDSPAQRKKRLAEAPPRAKQKQVTATVFVRNPDVVAEALLRADGLCESCGSKAPFLRKSDGSPYLEVHHIKRLADGGEDTLRNVKALCPNCHRESHYGSNKESFL
ncbi:HNH endonuclease [Idiomarina loihiensis]|uniref:HNH endonuclease n=1 Tax=Idiomarina TaxID=135575 RepID=UPI000D714A91|nr:MULTISPECIES: HNH endonuclease signature motif containing protein [Idiomarina]PWW40310.1 HNH endonuclease [Idiomarina loihiensis]TDP50001.1 HNH endonuclease [Idiomarina loihiensis]TDS24647.1 HNH endonuclease [Idiomarina sp. H2]